MMRFARLGFPAILVGVAAVAASGPLLAQQLSRLQPGQRVRVTIPSAGLAADVARFVAMSPDTLVIQSVPRHGAVAEQMAVPMRSVQLLEVIAGERYYTGLGAALGALTGAAAGAIYGYNLGDDPEFQPWVCPFLLVIGCKLRMTAPEKAVLMGLGGAWAGGAAGALLGWLVRTDRWEPVPLEPVSAPQLWPGQRVRISAPDAGLARNIVRVVGWSPDTLVVRGAPAHSSVTVQIAVPTRSVQLLEAIAGQRRRAGLGAALGALTGATAGAIYGFSLGDTSMPPEACSLPFTTGCLKHTAAEKAVVYGFGGLFLGGVAGTLLGWLVRTDRWEPVPLDSLRLSMAVRTRDYSRLEPRRHLALDRLRLAIAPLPGSRIGLGASLAF